MRPTKNVAQITLWMHKTSFFFAQFLIFQIFRFDIFRHKCFYFEYRIPDGSPGRKLYVYMCTLYSRCAQWNHFRLMEKKLPLLSIWHNDMEWQLFDFCCKLAAIHIKQKRSRSLFVITTTNLPPSPHNKATIHMETNGIRTRVHAIIFPVLLCGRLCSYIYIDKCHTHILPAAHHDQQE